jgi:hypothetical protein
LEIVAGPSVSKKNYD